MHARFLASACTLFALFLSFSPHQSSALTAEEADLRICASRVSIRGLKNEINSWQASVLAIKGYFEYDFDFAVANVLHGMEQLQMADADLTSTMKTSMGGRRELFNIRVAHFDQLLDAERIALDDLDLTLFGRSSILSARIDAFRAAAKAPADFYNSLKQADAQLMLPFLMASKRILQGKTGPEVERFNLMIKEVEEQLLLVNTAMETAKIIHDAASTELQNILSTIVVHFDEIKNAV